MSAVATKPRAAKRASLPAAKGPAAVLAEIIKALEHARGLVLGADKAAGDEGDSGSTLLFFAQTELTKAQRMAAPHHDAMNDLTRTVFDIQALVQGCAALHAGDARGLLAQQADATLEPLHAVLDAPGFWPKVQQAVHDEPAPAAPDPTPADSAPEDDACAACAHIQAASALLNLWLLSNDDGAMHGVCALIETAKASAEVAAQGHQPEAIQQMNGDLHNAAEVLSVIAEVRDISPIWGILFLLDAAIEKGDLAEASGE